MVYATNLKQSLYIFCQQDGIILFSKKDFVGYFIKKIRYSTLDKPAVNKTLTLQLDLVFLYNDENGESSNNLSFLTPKLMNTGWQVRGVFEDIKGYYWVDSKTTMII